MNTKKGQRKKAPVRGAPEYNQRPLLSAALIIKDCAPILGRCLSSLKGLADEIVLVDTGADRETLKVAEQYHARVIPYITYDLDGTPVHRKWAHHFGHARKFSLQQCRGKYIIWLDPDEMVPASSHAAIRAWCEDSGMEIGNVRTLVNATYKPPEQDFEGYGPAAAIMKPKVIKNVPGIKFIFRIHEDVFMPPNDNSAVTGELIEDVFVFNYGDSTIDNNDYYTALLMLERRDNPTSAHAAMYLADKALAGGSPEGALQTLHGTNPDGLNSPFQKEKFWLSAGRAHKALAMKAKAANNPEATKDSFQKSATAYKKAFEAAGQPICLLETAILLIDFESPEQGINALRAVVEQFPDYTMAAFILRIIEGQDIVTIKTRIFRALQCINQGKNPMELEAEICADVQPGPGANPSQPSSDGQAVMQMPPLVGKGAE